MCFCFELVIFICLWALFWFFLKISSNNNCLQQEDSCELTSILNISSYEMKGDCSVDVGKEDWCIHTVHFCSNGKYIFMINKERVEAIVLC